MSEQRRVMGLDWDYELPTLAVRETFHCRETNCAAFYREDAERFVSIGAACIITAWQTSTHDSVAGFITISPNGLRGQKYQKAIESVMGNSYCLGGKSFPCWFIGQLARADKPELKGLGKAMVWLAIMDIVQRAHHGAGSCIIIEAENRPLIDFYMREFDFEPLHPTLQHWEESRMAGNAGRMMLFLPISKARQMIQAAMSQA